jgi:molecular chaperone DnaK (HSP70)
MLIESKNDAESIIKAIENVLEEHKKIVKKTEKEEILKKVNMLKYFVSKDDLFAIRSHIREIEALTRPIAEKIMNTAVSSTLKNKNVKKIK